MPVITRESRNIFSDNPVVFMLDLQDALKDGFRAENTIVGFPSLNAILKEMRVFKPDVVTDITQRFTETEITITNYDSTLFIMDVQAAMLEGYEVDRDMVRFDNPKVCRMIKTAEVVQDEVEATAEEVIAATAPQRNPRRKQKAKQGSV